MRYESKGAVNCELLRGTNFWTAPSISPWRRVSSCLALNVCYMLLVRNLRSLTPCQSFALPIWKKQPSFPFSSCLRELWTYDFLGRLVKEQGPEGLHNDYNYIAEENRIVQTNALDESLDTQYDILVTRETVNVVKAITYFEYDAKGKSTYTYAAHGLNACLLRVVHVHLHHSHP